MTDTSHIFHPVVHSKEGKSLQAHKVNSFKRTILYVIIIAYLHFEFISFFSFIHEKIKFVIMNLFFSIYVGKDFHPT